MLALSLLYPLRSIHTAVKNTPGLIRKKQCLTIGQEIGHSLVAKKLDTLNKQLQKTLKLA